MRLVRPGLVVLGTVALLVAAACVGGPGPIDQGGENSDQYGGVQNEGRTSTSTGNSTKKTTPSATVTTTPTTPPTPTTTATTKPPPADLRGSDYDQTCTKDTDCKAIFEGPACLTCKCDNAAVSSKDFTKYSLDRSKRQADCPVSPGGGSSCAPCATLGQAHCSNNKCAVGPGAGGDAGP